MIVRGRGSQLELITQPDHARLAGDILIAWRADGFPSRRTRDTVLVATREHDRGWVPVDAAPPLDEEGRPFDFLRTPDSIKQQLWPRAVEELGPASAYAAALVAQHALTIYDQSHQGPAWTTFFATLTDARDNWLRRSNESAAQLDVDYRLVRLADLISLAFCNGWTESYKHAGYELQLAGDTLTLKPDPFDRRRVPLRVAMRTVPNHRYASTDDLRSALSDAPTSYLNGICEGA